MSHHLGPILHGPDVNTVDHMFGVRSVPTVDYGGFVVYVRMLVVWLWHVRNHGAVVTGNVWGDSNENIWVHDKDQRKTERALHLWVPQSGPTSPPPTSKGSIPLPLLTSRASCSNLPPLSPGQLTSHEFHGHHDQLCHLIRSFLIPPGLSHTHKWQKCVTRPSTN